MKAEYLIYLLISFAVILILLFSIKLFQAIALEDRKRRYAHRRDARLLTEVSARRDLRL